MGHRLDFVNFKYAKVGAPAMKAKQRVMISTDVFRQGLASDGMVEHPAYGYAVDIGRFDTKTNDPSREYIHHHHDPMTAQQNGLAAEQIEAPQAIFGLRDECQPRGASGTRVVWPVMLGEYTAHDIFIDIEAKGVGYLLRNAHAAKLGIKEGKTRNGNLCPLSGHGEIA